MRPVTRSSPRYGRSIAALAQPLRDLPHPARHTAPDVAHHDRQGHAGGGDGAHRVAEHPHAVVAQPTIGRVSNRGLHDRGVHTQAPAPRDGVLAGERHDAVEHLAEHGRVQELAPPYERLGIGDAAAAEPAEVAIDHVAAHLPLQLIVAPPFEVLEHQQPQHRLGWRRRSTPARTLRAPLPHHPPHRPHQLLILEQRIDASQDRVHQRLGRPDHAKQDDVPQHPLPVSPPRHADRPRSAASRVQANRRSGHSPCSHRTRIRGAACYFRTAV